MRGNQSELVQEIIMVYWTNIYMEPNIVYFSIKIENLKHAHPEKNDNLALSFRIVKREKNEQDLSVLFFLEDITLRNSVSSLVIVKPEGPTCAIF